LANARPSSPVDPRLLLALIGAVALVYAAVSALSTGTGAIHEDMAEAYVWGSHFELGYYKHPPLWAWMAGGWFEVFPRTAWSFALLCAANVVAGLWGAWMLIGRFAHGDRRLAALVLLLVTPFYGFQAYVFNANAIFISLWPWTAYAFVRAMDERRVAPSLIFGAMAAACMLSKYYALVLLLALAPAAIAHPKAKAYFTSLSPWISVAAGALLVAPHAWWLAQSGFLPFHYFGDESGHDAGFSVATAAKLFAGDIALLGGAIAMVLIAARRRLAATPARLKTRLADPRFRVMAILAILPFLLTLVFGLVFRLKLSTNWTIAVFPLAPLLLIDVFDPPDDRRLALWAASLGVLLAAAALVAAPFAPALSTASKAVQPRREAVAAAVAFWRAQTPAPLLVVGGDETYGDAAGFYAPGRPAVFIRFDPAISPWVDVANLPRIGLLALCPANDARCLAGAWRYRTPQTRWTRLVLPSHEKARAATAAGYAFIVAATPPGPPGQ